MDITASRSTKYAAAARVYAGPAGQENCEEIQQR
jgi:hypothetical protein